MKPFQGKDRSKWSKKDESGKLLMADVPFTKTWSELEKFVDDGRIKVQSQYVFHIFIAINQTSEKH